MTKPKPVQKKLKYVDTSTYTLQELETDGLCQKQTNHFSEYDVKKVRKNWLREREKRKLSKFCLQRAFIPKALILKNEAIKTFDPLAATVHLRILLRHWLLKKFYCKKINNTRYVNGIKMVGW